ncbi:hypothetical protein PMIN01_10406 [Paraphaeosphaeria minitans]|uniref:Uncharacterized protein n=1 Tax=Paraphaeosphaeria minitans TaxID=565426 RepID=A0A9P6GBW7_9PLEO|nr:hypothetical protein PMIN01_10406 [Paraphaeosphaeria minitans]
MRDRIRVCSRSSKRRRWRPANAHPPMYAIGWRLHGSIASCTVASRRTKEGGLVGQSNHFGLRGANGERSLASNARANEVTTPLALMRVNKLWHSHALSPDVPVQATSGVQRSKATLSSGPQAAHPPERHVTCGLERCDSSHWDRVDATIQTPGPRTERPIKRRVTIGMFMRQAAMHANTNAWQPWGLMRQSYLRFQSRIHALSRVYVWNAGSARGHPDVFGSAGGATPSLGETLLSKRSRGAARTRGRDPVSAGQREAQSPNASSKFASSAGARDVEQKLAAGANQGLLTAVA